MGKKKDKKKERRKVKDKKTDALVSDEEGIPDGVDMNDPFFAEEFGDEFKNAEDSDNKSKKKKEASKPVEDTFEVDVADERFGALFNRAEFNIDPTESNFKKTKNMEKIIAEKMKRIESSTLA